MSNETAVLLPICVTLLLALVATVWRASAMMSKLEAALDSVQKTIATMTAKLERLDAIPVHERRIIVLEDALRTATSRIDTVWRKMFSLDKRVAVARASSGQFDNGDSDPPTNGEDNDG